MNDEKELSHGQYLADLLASIMGSWKFIIFQTVTLAVWIAINVVAYTHHWDPYPFILLNLMLSFQAAYSGPIIMMAQNRQAAKDRLAAEEDYLVNVRAEEEVKQVMMHLAKQDDTMIDILRRIEAQHRIIMDKLDNKPPEDK